MRHILLGIIWRKTAADPVASLLRSPHQAVETERCLSELNTTQAPVGVDREDRGKLLFPRPDPGSTPAPAKRKAGGNKNLRQGDP